MMSNIKLNALFTADNLSVLKGMNSESVDLIYLDPPFNSERVYKARTGSKAEGAEFKDTWTLADVDSKWLSRLPKTHPTLAAYFPLVAVTHSKSMMAYIAYISRRLLEMHRVLKSTGSIYLHVDPTASHYLKVVMDRIFGKDNYRNEIIWKRKANVQNGGEHQLGRNHDVILYYTKGDKSPFYKKFAPYDDAYIEKTYKHCDSQGRYATFPCTHQAGSEYEFQGITRKWRFEKNRMAQMFNDGLLTQSKPDASFRYKKYLKDAKGVPLQSIWVDISPASGDELTDYPTQKPLELLHRIIELSSMPGDIVLDPFCGSATTCVAAQMLDRRWIGIDISSNVVPLIRKRIGKEVGDMLCAFAHFTEPPTRTDRGD